MIIIFELHGTNHAAGNTSEDQLNDEYRQSREYFHLGDNHAVFATGFVTELVENHEEGDDKPLIIPLPAFIAMKTFILFCKHLLHYQNADRQVGFGKYANLTYKSIHQNHRGYINSLLKHTHTRAQDQNNPCRQMVELFEWVDGINTIRTNWGTSGQDIKRVATYFLIDICSDCGLIISTQVKSERVATRNANETLGRLPSHREIIRRIVRESFRNANGRDNENKLSPCNRTSWPNVTAFPVWEDVMIAADLVDNESNSRSAVHARRQWGAWIDAWKAYDRDLAHGRTVCLNTDLLCLSCVKESPRACRQCSKWECSHCEQDTETPQHFERCNETDPRVFVDDYNIRDETPYKDLNIRPCLHCARRVCKDENCGAECIYCHRRACMRCKNNDDIQSMCERCEHEYEQSDLPVTPRWICRSCFEREPRICESCGEEPCYDPNASDSDSENEEDCIIQ